MPTSSAAGLRVTAAVATLTAAICAACGAPPTDPAASSTTTSAPPPIVPLHGTATNLDGFISNEAPVYAEPTPGDALDPKRIWTLTPGTKVTAFCQDITHEVVPYSSYTYVSWAPDKSGWIFDGDLEITTRTSDTNASLSTFDLKPCGNPTP